MRAAATVGRLMPSPTNRITLRAVPCMAPLAAAWAAPWRNHQEALSPSGWRMSGTPTATPAAAGVAAGVGAGAGRLVVAHAAAERVTVAASAHLANGCRDMAGLGSRVSRPLCIHIVARRLRRPLVSALDGNGCSGP